MSTIESTQQASRAYPPPAALARNAAISGLSAYQALCDEAETDFEGFWARLAREELLWSKPFTKVLDESTSVQDFLDRLWREVAASSTST